MDLFKLVVAAKLTKGEGGGSEPVIEPLSVTDNGTYSAPSGVDGYSPVTVNVPKGITPSGTISITQNGTVDVTQYASADVNVSGGGGASSVIAFSFTTIGSTGVQEVGIPYTGDGYPIQMAVLCDNDNSIFNSTSYKFSAVTFMLKAHPDTAPTYKGADGTVAADATSGYEMYRYSATNMSRWSLSGTGMAYDSKTDPTSGTKVKIASYNKIKVYVSDNSNVAGLAPNAKYYCFVKYSE